MRNLFVFGSVLLLSAQQQHPQLHADVWTLIKLDGSVQRIQAGYPAMVEAGRAEMMRVCKTCSPKFGEEWARRMNQRANPNDFADAIARVYEKHLTPDDVHQLIALENAKKAGKPAAVTAALRQKLNTLMPTIQKEASAACGEVGRRLGSQVGSEIGKEHPGYLVGKG